MRACVVERHSGLVPSVMVWDAIGYNIQSRLLRMQDNLNSYHYFREVLDLRYCCSSRQPHIPYFSRTMPGHMWR